MPPLRATWFNPCRKPLGSYNCHRISFFVEGGLISNVIFLLNLRRIQNHKQKLLWN
jgi:hypothetical protein